MAISALMRVWRRGRQGELFHQRRRRRKPLVRRRVAHRRRERFARTTPVHVTLRVREHVPHLRGGRAYRVVMAAFNRARALFHTRLCHFSVQGNHLHLVVEAGSEATLARAMQGLGVRLAKALNRLMRRHGTVFADRYHAHVLRTRSEVRAALAYVIGNRAKHAVERGRWAPFLDELSSFGYLPWAADPWSPLVLSSHRDLQWAEHVMQIVEHLRRRPPPDPQLPLELAPSGARG